MARFMPALWVQKVTKERSLHKVNEHLESFFNAASAPSTDFSNHLACDIAACPCPLKIIPAQVARYIQDLANKIQSLDLI